MAMASHAGPGRRGPDRLRRRAPALLVAGTMMLLAAGCSEKPTDHHGVAAGPSGATASPVRSTLIVEFAVGPHPTTAPLAALGRTHACRAWNITPGTYGLSTSVEHVILADREGRRALALLRKDPSVLSVRLAGPAAYEQVPASEPGFPKAWAGRCAVA